MEELFRTFSVCRHEHDLLSIKRDGGIESQGFFWKEWLSLRAIEFHLEDFRQDVRRGTPWAPKEVTTSRFPCEPGAPHRQAGRELTELASEHAL